MQRRTALKNIGLSFGALTLTPTVVSMLQSCQNTPEGWSPVFLSNDEATVIGKIIDVMLPTTASVPGAADLNLIQFIDIYLDGVSGEEEQQFAKMATAIFSDAALTAAGKEKVDDLSAEDIDAQLNKYLRASQEELAARGEAFSAYMQALAEGTAGEPPVDGVCQSYLFNLRSLAVEAFKENAIIAEEHLAYAPVPGQQKGCVDLQEATGGKAWAL